MKIWLIPNEGSNPSMLSFYSVNFLKGKRMKNYISVACLMLTACNPAGSDKSPVDGKPIKSVLPQKEEEKKSPLEILREVKTLSEVTKLMGNSVEDKPNRSNDATGLITYWSSFNMKWNDVFVQSNETSFKKSRKDIDEERFKRMCIDGRLIQIEVVKPVDKTRWFVGLMMDQYQNIYHFNAVKNSGELVGGSFATYCGLVTGLYDYSNSGGGTGHAVDMVGMFDLTENHPEIKKPKIQNPNKPAQNDMY